MKLRSAVILSVALSLSAGARAGIYDFGRYTPENEGYIPEDMLEFPDTPEAYVSGLWLSQDFLGREIKFVVQLAEGVPFVGEVGSTPIPVKVVQISENGTVTLQRLDGTQKHLWLKETDNGDRGLLVQPEGAEQAFRFKPSDTEYLTLDQVVQSAEDLKP